MHLAFTNKFPITYLLLKFLIEFMIHWHLYTTIIWDFWCPSPCELIMSLHHICIHRSEQAPHRRLRKMRQSDFVDSVHCDIPQTVMYIHF